MRHSSIFRSRWMALLWSAGIMWFAMDVANENQPDPIENGANVAAPADDAAIAETARLVRELQAR